MKKYRIKTEQTEVNSFQYTPQKRILFLWISYPKVFDNMIKAREYLDYQMKKDSGQHITYFYLHK